MNNANMPPIPTEKKLESSEIQYGECKFCQQMFAIETSGFMTEDDLDEAATRKCKCNESKNYRKRQQRKNEVLKGINEMFGEKSGVAVILAEQIDRIAAGDITSVTVDPGDGYKGKISMTSKGAIKIERSVSRKAVTEVNYE